MPAVLVAVDEEMQKNYSFSDFEIQAYDLAGYAWSQMRIGDTVWQRRICPGGPVTGVQRVFSAGSGRGLGYDYGKATAWG